MNNFKKLIKDHWIKPFVIAALFLICLSTSILMKKWFDIDGDYLSAFATIVAAGVALHLYTDWRILEEFKAKQSLHNQAVDALLKTVKLLNNITGQLKIIEHENKNIKNNCTMSKEREEGLSNVLQNTTKDVVIAVQDIIYDICTKIAMDYTKPLSSDRDLQFIFYTLCDIKVFIHDLTSQRGVNDKNRQNVIDFINGMNEKIDLEMSRRNNHNP